MTTIIFVWLQCFRYHGNRAIWRQFHQRFTCSFYMQRSRKSLKILMHWLSFCTFGIFESKSCWLCLWWNWHLVLISTTFYLSLFGMKVLFKAFVFLQFGFVIFSERILAQMLLTKCWWNWHMITSSGAAGHHFWRFLNIFLSLKCRNTA